MTTEREAFTPPTRPLQDRARDLIGVPLSAKEAEPLLRDLATRIEALEADRAAWHAASMDRDHQITLRDARVAELQEALRALLDLWDSDDDPDDVERDVLDPARQLLHQPREQPVSFPLVDRLVPIRLDHRTTITKINGDPVEPVTVDAGLYMYDPVTGTMIKVEQQPSEQP